MIDYFRKQCEAAGFKLIENTVDDESLNHLVIPTEEGDMDTGVIVMEGEKENSINCFVPVSAFCRITFKYTGKVMTDPEKGIIVLGQFSFYSKGI